ncbi:hemolysin III family protein [Paraburkholderia xenovorans]
MRVAARSESEPTNPTAAFDATQFQEPCNERPRSGCGDLLTGRHAAGEHKRILSRDDHRADSRAALMLIRAVALVAWPARHAGSVRVPTPAIAVYLSTMVHLCATSALYHGPRPERGKRLLMKLDYYVIYLFIAASYTPFAARY